MGYRSEVAYTIRFNNKEEADKFIEEAKNNEDTKLVFDDPDLKIANMGHCINYHVEGIKWHETIPEVKAHIELFNLAEKTCNTEDNEDIGAIFVRIGEDINDNEVLFYGNNEYHWLYVVRRLETDWEI